MARVCLWERCVYRMARVISGRSFFWPEEDPSVQLEWAEVDGPVGHWPFGWPVCMVPAHPFFCISRA